jgi:hypothetical protein
MRLRNALDHGGASLEHLGDRMRQPSQRGDLLPQRPAWERLAQLSQPQREQVHHDHLRNEGVGRRDAEL